jgi:hypothetical protein
MRAGVGTLTDGVRPTRPHRLLDAVVATAGTSARPNRLQKQGGNDLDEIPKPIGHAEFAIKRTVLRVRRVRRARALHRRGQTGEQSAAGLSQGQRAELRYVDQARGARTEAACLPLMAASHSRAGCDQLGTPSLSLAGMKIAPAAGASHVVRPDLTRQFVPGAPTWDPDRAKRGPSPQARGTNAVTESTELRPVVVMTETRGGSWLGERPRGAPPANRELNHRRLCETIQVCSGAVPRRALRVRRRRHDHDRRFGRHEGRRRYRRLRSQQQRQQQQQGRKLELNRWYQQHHEQSGHEWWW